MSGVDVRREMRVCLNEELNPLSLSTVFSACVSILYLQLGRQIHGLAGRMEMEFDTVACTALVDVYSKCGCWRWAYVVIKELNGHRNFILWFRWLHV